MGLNVRMALEDATLSTGGGKTGQEPLAVPKDTTISQYKKLIITFGLAILLTIEYSLLIRRNAATQGHLGRRSSCLEA